MLAAYKPIGYVLGTIQLAFMFIVFTLDGIGQLIGIIMVCLVLKFESHIYR